MNEGDQPVSGMPLAFLRLEAFCAFLFGLYLFSLSGWSWWWFAGLFLFPDVAIAAYLGGPRLGAVIYNLAHTYAAPAVPAAAGMLGAGAIFLALGGIWITHIGFDRMLGFGLKYQSAFRNTHLGRVGKPAA